MTTRIVLIEDDPAIAALIEEILADLGHQVDVHPHLTDGTIDGDADLVIADLVGLRGYELESARRWIARVRVAFPKAAVIVSTAHAPAALSGGPALGADAVVTKPFDIAEFTETVESLLGR